jgi:hypothetical protein
MSLLSLFLVRSRDIGAQITDECSELTAEHPNPLTSLSLILSFSLHLPYLSLISLQTHPLHLYPSLSISLLSLLPVSSRDIGARVLCPLAPLPLLPEPPLLLVGAL